MPNSFLKSDKILECFHSVDKATIFLQKLKSLNKF